MRKLFIFLTQKKNSQRPDLKDKGFKSYSVFLVFTITYLNKLYWLASLKNSLYLDSERNSNIYFNMSSSQKDITVNNYIQS